MRGREAGEQLEERAPGSKEGWERGRRGERERGEKARPLQLAARAHMHTQMISFHLPKKNLLYFTQTKETRELDGGRWLLGGNTYKVLYST